MPERLLVAVQELNRSVKALERTLHNDYPKRAEVEHRFSTKNSAHVRVVAFVMSLVLAIIGSFFVTVSTISYCFLGGAETGNPPPICNSLPGYPEAQEANRKLLKQFRDMISIMESNQERIKKLERQVK